jgi:hypothetical protein
MSDDDLHEPAPLRADARRMLATWREADQMPRASKQRVWKRLRGDAARRTVPPARSTTWMWAVALAAAIVLLWWGSAITRRSARDEQGSGADQAVDDRVRTDHEHSVREPPQSVAPAPVGPPPSEVALPAAPVERPSITEAPRPNESGPRPRGPSTRPGGDVPTPDAPPAPTTTLARERDVIARAWSALADGDPGSALQRAAEHELAFPDGLLAPERRAIAVIARCKRGDEGAAARAQTWLDMQPRSPLAGRVRAACISPSP